jgi:hypothetical protein
VLCVLPRSVPITVGPTKPPRLPIELISAMPAAAAVPPRKIGGMAQNTLITDRWPTCDSAKLSTMIITLS